MNKYPLCIVIYLTDYCNLKCKHCFLTQTNSLNKNILDFDVLEKQLEIFKKENVFMIAYTGGDPMLHQDLFKILEYTKDLGMLPLLGISGVNVSIEDAEKIYNNGVRCVQVGLNGSNDEINDYYRGKGNFKEVLTTINNLKDSHINVNIAFCIDKNNFNDINNMLDLATKLDAYKVKIEFWNCVNSKCSLKELNEKEKDDIRNICNEYMKRINKYDWIQYPKATTNLSKIHHNALVIMANGDVKKNELGKTLGNIYQKNIDEILEDNGNE